MQKTDWTSHPSSQSYVVLDVTNRGIITTTFLYIGPFLSWWPTNNQMILVQALSWPGWKKQSFVISDLSMWRWWNQLGAKSAARSTHPRGPNQSRNTQCSGSLQHFSALAVVNLKRSRGLIGEKCWNIYVFLQLVFLIWKLEKGLGRARGPAQNTLAPQPTRANTQSIKVIFVIFSKGYFVKILK